MQLLMTGPVNIHLHRQIRWALDAGHSVSVISPSLPVDILDRIEHHFSTPRIHGSRLLARLTVRHFNCSLFDFSVAMTLRKMLKKYRFDCIHINWIDCFAYRLAWARSDPLILTAWGSDINRLSTRTAIDRDARRIRAALRTASVVTADSADVLEKCRLMSDGVPHVSHFSLGIDTQAFQRSEISRAAFRRRLGVPDNAVVFLSPRAWERRYGHLKILQAFAIARSRLRVPSFVVFKKYTTVPDRQFECDFDLEVSRLNLNGSVVLLEELRYSELPALYSAADVLLNWPDLDAFPVTFLEAAACQISVVSVFLEGYRGTFAERYFSLVDSPSTESFADSMLRVVDSNGGIVGQNLAEARQVIIAMFGEKQAAANLGSLYALSSSIKRSPISHVC